MNLELWTFISAHALAGTDFDAAVGSVEMVFSPIPTIAFAMSSN
jgi:hypothetical protein